MADNEGPVEPLNPEVPFALRSFGNVANIIGFLQIHVPEARDVAAMDFGGTSDPYHTLRLLNAPVYQNLVHKSKKHKKTLHPQWPGAVYHFWLHALPVDIHLELFDHDSIGKDDFLGALQIHLDTTTDLAEDRWHTLQKRAGREKKDKQVRGDVRMKVSIKLFQNFVWTPETLFPTHSYVILEPHYRNPGIVEIQGEIDDFQLLSALRALGVSLPLPQKVYHRKTGEFLKWNLTVDASENHTVAKYYQDLIQDLTMKIANSLSMLGMTIFRAEPKRNERAIWMIRSQPPGPGCKFVLVETSFVRRTRSFQVDLQGEVEEELLASLKDTFNAYDFGFKTPTGHFHTCWGLVIPNSDKLRSVTTNGARRRENVLQNYLLRVMEQLTRLNYYYVTAYGDSHLFVKARQPLNGLGSFLLLDPSTGIVEQRWKTTLQLQGHQVDQQFTTDLIHKSFKPDFKVDLTKFTFEGKDLFWGLVLPQFIPPSNTVRSSVKYNIRENWVQNAELQALNGLSTLGYHFVSFCDQDAFLLQHQPSRPPTRYVLLDPRLGVLELQGVSDWTDGNAAALGSATGFPQLFKLNDPTTNQLVAWQFPFKFPSQSVIEKLPYYLRGDKIHHQTMNVVGWLHTVACYEPIGQVGDDQILFRHNPTRLPGKFFAVDYHNAHDVWIKFHGDIEEALVGELCQVVSSLAPVKIIDPADSMLVGWKVNTGIKTRVLESVNRTQNALLKIFSRLVHLGWMLRFTWRRQGSKCYVFFKQA